MNTKFLPLAFALSLCAANSFAQTITPTRVGPVSQYGQLMSGKNAAGEGRIYGGCQGVKDGAEVQVRGMSLYWSLLPQSVEYWSEEGIASMVNDMNIQIIRAAMATGTEDWSGEFNGKKLVGYEKDSELQKNFVKTVVEAAIKQDIYVIIDWHSHNANEKTESPKKFFAEMAQAYGSYDNVIFELYNEPTDISWETIKNYADQVIPEIRKYSDNLILIGNPKWDQNPQMAIGNEVTDSGNNHAYTLHYYANSHCVSGTYDWGGSCQGENGLKAMKAGLSVFLSEWGTGNADGGGDPNQEKNTQWQKFADQNKLSWANWSASHISEGTAAFTSSSNKNSLQYSTSGNLVKSYLATNPTSYTKCADTPSPEAITSIRAAKFGLQISANTVQLLNAKNPTIHVYDLQGHSLLSAHSNSLSLQKLAAGTYIVKARDGMQTQMKTIRVNP